MTALYIILGILLAFFLLSLLRLGVRVEFTGSLAETRVAVIAGPARIQLLPKPEKPEKPQKEKKKKEKPAKAKAEGGEKKKLHLTKEDIKDIKTEPTLTFTAYAVQRDGIDKAADAWTKVAATTAKP